MNKSLKERNRYNNELHFTYRNKRHVDLLGSALSNNDDKRFDNILASLVIIASLIMISGLVLHDLLGVI